MHRLGALCLVIAISGCHVSAQARAPLPPPEARVATAIAAWGEALRSGDEDKVRATEDGLGRAAIAYVAVKAVASHVDGGAEAVETTVFMTVLTALLMTVWPGFFGAYPEEGWLLVLPAGALGPLLVDAGLAVDEEDGLTAIEVPYDQTLDRIEAASAQHRARLRERQASTCRPSRIERTILPTEPSLVRAAALSPHAFTYWLDDVDAIWVVRADCADGPGLFVVTGRVDPDDGTTTDLILAATLLSSTTHTAPPPPATPAAP